LSVELIVSRADFPSAEYLLLPAYRMSAGRIRTAAVSKNLVLPELLLTFRLPPISAAASSAA
jgi:hypothetical protein